MLYHMSIAREHAAPAALALVAALVGALVAAVAVVAGPAAPARGQQPVADTDRIAGADRYETAAALAAERFPDGAETAYVATGERFADALAAGPAAALDDAPVLLVRPSSVPQATEEALESLGVSRVVVLGGLSAVSGDVADRLAVLTGNPVSRLSGATRYETAATVSERFAPGVEVAYVASGGNFPDALGGAAAGAATSGPVLLASRDGLGPATRAALARLRPGRVDVLGGTAVLSDAVLDELRAVTGSPVRRLSGPDRFATSAAVSAATYPTGASMAYLATGVDFPDALAAAPVAGLGQAPLLLATRDCVPEPVVDELARLGVERVVLVGGGAVLGRGPARLEPCGVAVTVVESGLSVPWDVAFTPDGRVFVTERDTRRLLRLGSGQPTVVHTFTGVDTSSEGGVLGLAASPDFAEDGYLYVYLTTPSDNRVVRLRPDSQPVSPEPVVTGIPRRASIHHGGRIAFGPDGLLYITTGDAGQPALSQDPGSLAGKILRVRPDGSVPPGNPTPGSRVFARGLRNSQGLAFGGGRLYATEFGPGCDDEINLIVPGGNYGWPEACGETRPGTRPPLVVRQPAEASWSGLALLTDGLISPWEGDLFAASLRGRRLWRFRVEGGRVTQAQSLLAGEYGRLRHVEQAPDGSLWVLTNNRDGRGSPGPGDDRILRLAPPGW